MNREKENLLNYFTLFGSMSTLVCCALPALLVSLGLGAVMMGLASNVPALVWASENKSTLFIVSAVLLSLNGLLLWTKRNAPCPVDPKLRDACIQGRKFSLRVFLTSLIIYATGFVFAYVLPFINQ